MPFSVADLARAKAFRISPKDTNYFVILFDQVSDRIDNIFVIEVFKPGGATPPNEHPSAHEFFHVLHGQGVARCAGKSVPLKKGDSLLLHPGSEHVVENTGAGKLYTLTVMTPNEGFAELIRGGEPVALDAEDIRILQGLQAMDGSPNLVASDEALQPLGSSERNRWMVSEASADLVRPAVRPRPITVRARSKQVTFDLARTAVLVVDMQNDFCHPNGWLAHLGVDIAPTRRPIVPLQRLLPALRACDVPVIWVNWGNRPDRLNLSPSLLHVYKPSGTGVGLGDALPGSNAKVLERGSWSAAIVDELAVAPSDIQVAKYRMSGFQDTELDSILRNLGVTTLMFAGVNADQCVLCTLQDANFRGYDCLLLEDCTATTSPDYCMAATIYNVNQCFGFVVRSDAMAAALAQRASEGEPS